jgi:hypothetical protein
MAEADPRVGATDTLSSGPSLATHSGSIMQRIQSLAPLQGALALHRLTLAHVGFFLHDQRLTCSGCAYDWSCDAEHDFISHRNTGNTQQCPVLRAVGPSLAHYLAWPGVTRGAAAAEFLAPNPTSPPRLEIVHSLTDNTLVPPPADVDISTAGLSIGDPNEVSAAVKHFLDTAHARLVRKLGFTEWEVRGAALHAIATSRGLPESHRETVALLQRHTRSSDPFEGVLDAEEDPGLARCVVCLVAPVSRVFALCGHLCCCQHCAVEVTRCPMCRSAVVGIIPANLPSNT